MEVNQFFKRIRNAETAVGHTLGHNENDFIKLIEPSSVQEVKQPRLKLDYCRTILKAEQMMINQLNIESEK